MTGELPADGAMNHGASEQCHKSQVQLPILCLIIRH